MSLEHIISNASLERGHYHQLATRELEKLDDAEALYERGRRLRNGIDVLMDEEAGWKLFANELRQQRDGDAIRPLPPRGKTGDHPGDSFGCTRQPPAWLDREVRARSNYPNS